MPAQSQSKRQSAPLPEEKPAKRTRVSRACDQCRVAREKCDGLQPTCSTCSGTTRKCSYMANPKKRGIQPGYIRTLELALAWLFQHNLDNESALKEKLAQGGASSLLLSRDSKESNKLHRRWRKSKFYIDVDKQLSGGEPSRHEQVTSPGSFSSDEDLDTEDPLEKRASRSQTSNIKFQRSVEPPDIAQMAASSHKQPARFCAPETIPQDSWQLFEIYFTNIHSWLPICEKHDTLKSAYSYPLHSHSSNSEQSISGAYAEMWSILAVASLYDANLNDPLGPSSARPMKLYETARSMVPGESGRFDVEHIRALLNLVVFNISRMLTGSAWLLVGYASRALEDMDQSTLMANSRHKHVYYGCLLLDGMLAFQLNRRPHFRKSDLGHLGPIDEDGLEEWQPWSGFIDPTHASRMTPLLSLSTFNNVIELVDILVSTGQQLAQEAYQEEAAQRLESWKTCLPSKVDSLFSGRSFSLLAPPAALLQATYDCAYFISHPSDISLQLFLKGLDKCQLGIGVRRLPVPIKCLVVTINRLASQLNLCETTRNQLQSLRAAMLSTSPQLDHDDSQTLESSIMPARRSSTTINLSTPESLQTATPEGRNIAQPTIDPLNDFFPGSYPTNPSHVAVPSPSQTDPRYPELTSDLETFFDELASLDTATRPENQPQFMQNLGFGPGASMADLFSEYIPMQSSNFLVRDDAAPTNLDQYVFYDGI